MVPSSRSRARWTTTRPSGGAAHALTIRLDHILVQGRQVRSHLRVQATLYGGVPVHYGDLVLLSGRLETPPSFEQFDYRTYLSEQGIAAVMQAAVLVRDTPHPGDPLHTALFSIRHGLTASVDRALPEPQGALLLGEVFGYRAALPLALEQQMIASGLIHIVVISGLKVSLLARVIHQGLGRAWPAAAPGVALVAMVTYALLAGASAAALRAAAMGALVVIAGRLRRDTHVYVSLALTAAIMLGLKPALARDVSFQLSFAGTLGIASMTDGIAARLTWMPGVLRDPFAATVAAEAATWPLMLANFHQLSLVAPAANALVLPLLPVTMVIGGGGAILATVVAAAGWPALQVAGAIAAWFVSVIQVGGSLPAAAIVTPYFPGGWLAAALVLNGSALARLQATDRLLAASGMGGTGYADGAQHCGNPDPPGWPGARLRAGCRIRVRGGGADRQRQAGADRRRSRRGQIRAGDRPRASPNGPGAGGVGDHRGPAVADRRRGGRAPAIPGGAGHRRRPRPVDTDAPECGAAGRCRGHPDHARRQAAAG